MDERATQVLLIEDNPGDARLIRLMLEESADHDFRVATAERLSSGLERLAQGGVDVVLLDLGLPDSEGLETSRQLRAQAPGVPVVILSGLDDREVAVDAVKEGAQDYLVKRELDANLLVRSLTYAIERHRAQQALRDSRKEWESTFEGMSDWVAVLEPQSRRILRSNSAGKQITGAASAQMVDQVCCSLLHGTDEPLPGCPVPEMLRTRQRSTIELPLPDKDQWLMISVDPILDEGGNVIAVAHVVSDITERKRAEEKLKEYSRRLEEMVRERTKDLREAHEELVRKEKLAVLGQLAGGVSHELRNPLGTISNAVYFLKMTIPDADEKTTEYLEMIRAEVSSAEKIISDLLDFSRTRAADRKDTSVSDLVAEVLERQAPPEEVKVSTNLPSDVPAVFVDSQQMVQVLVNLVTNAYQAMPEGGTLTIKTSEVSGRPPRSREVAISITDTGVGIPEENLEKLFEPLFTTKAKGIGLGLAVSKSLVEVNGGSIEVQSEEGKGSTFTVILPTAELES